MRTIELCGIEWTVFVYEAPTYKGATSHVCISKREITVCDDGSAHGLLTRLIEAAAAINDHFKNTERKSP